VSVATRTKSKQNDRLESIFVASNAQLWSLDGLEPGFRRVCQLSPRHSDWFCSTHALKTPVDKPLWMLGFR
jgi:hypothetical protein